MAVTIRPERPDVFDAIHTVVAEAFDSIEHAQLVRDIRSAERYWADAALVATVEDAVVGHVMISSAEGSVTHSFVPRVQPRANAASRWCCCRATRGTTRDSAS